MSRTIRVGTAAASRLIVTPSSAQASKSLPLPRSATLALERNSPTILRLLALALVDLNVTKFAIMNVHLFLVAAVPSSALPILLLTMEWLVRYLPTLRQAFLT